MKFCSVCGGAITRRVPLNDDRERHVCDSCDTVHYVNPRIVVGCLPVLGERVLLCRRAIHPRRDYWTLPAGFMENGETTLEGARRETWEEARASVEDEALYTIIDLPHISQVYMFYRARLGTPDFAPGAESLEVALFEEDGIPWEKLAFPVVNVTLKRFFADRPRGVFPVHTLTLRPGDWGR
jgi:ADP-ribose pyrophosphatase YjhB (NUDIX family)